MFKLATAATFQSPMLPCVVVAVVGLVVQGPTVTAGLMLASVMGRRWATAVGEKTSSGRAGRLGDAEMAGSEARRRHNWGGVTVP